MVNLEGIADTYPEHDCYNPQTTISCSQNDCKYEKCGVCDRIIQFQWRILKKYSEKTK